MQSPYRATPMTKSASGGDLVTGIIDKFNLLSVVDRDEERAQSDRQIAKLRAALDRAQIAREEAETEATHLRERFAELQSELETEHKTLKDRISEHERKYDKAKERFKQQRAKNDEAIRKVHADYLEVEKNHWRTIAVAHEETQWERQLRMQAYELLDFVGAEHVIDMDILARRRRTLPVLTVSTHGQQGADGRDLDLVEDKTTRAFVSTGRRSNSSRRSSRSRTSTAADDASPTVTPPTIATILESESAIESDDSSRSDLAVPTALVPPITGPRSLVTNKVPVDFGEDKENQTPLYARAGQPKTPLTIDRAAALAAIQYRRGRAQSFVNSQTPKRLILDDRRDVSAPPLVTMTIGRSRA